MYVGDSSICIGLNIFIIKSGKIDQFVWLM